MRKIILVLAAIVVVTLLNSVDLPIKRDLNEPETAVLNKQVESEKVFLSIVYSENNKNDFEYDFEKETTAFDILNNTAEKENISLDTEHYDFGVFVKAINGKESTAELAWIYFVNGESGAIAADQHKLSEGDVVEWKFIKPEF